MVIDINVYEVMGMNIPCIKYANFYVKKKFKWNKLGTNKKNIQTTNKKDYASYYHNLPQTKMNWFPKQVSHMKQDI